MELKYYQVILNIINQIEAAQAIFTEDIALKMANAIGINYVQAKKLTNLYLKRLADDKVIVRMRKGVYYKPKQTAFGELKPPYGVMITEMVTVHLGQIIGYITGSALLHQLGLTTQLPKNKEIATNKYRTKVENSINIVLKKPRIEINTDNYKYLQYLDAVDCLKDHYIDADNAIEILQQTIQDWQLDFLKLIKFAKDNYSQRTLLRLLDIILENAYETAS